MTSPSHAESGDSPSCDDSTDLHPMYQTHNDDHDAETLSDFGLDLPLNKAEGILVEPSEFSHVPLGLKRDDEFPVEHLVIQPVGVGPAQTQMFNDVDGAETVFVNIHPVREYDIPGHYVQAETHTPVTSIERNVLETLAHQNTTPLRNHTGMITRQYSIICSVPSNRSLIPVVSQH